MTTTPDTTIPDAATPPGPAARAGRPDATRVPVRWRILGWILLVTGIGLVALVVTVSSSLQTQHARQANSDVTQELTEFTDFVRENADPATGQAATTADGLIESYLLRQRPSGSEVMIGLTDSAGVTHALVGDRVPVVDGYDAAADADLIAASRSDASGVTQTAAGEARWGVVHVQAPDGSHGSLLVAVFMQPAYDEAARVTRTVTWVAVGALALTGVIGWLAAGRILHPIRQMRRTAARITEGHLARRIPVEGRDDLAALAGTFNDMLDRIEDAFRSEQRFADEAFTRLHGPLDRVGSTLTDLRATLSSAGQARPEAMRLLGEAEGEVGRMRAVVADLLVLAGATQPGFVRPRPHVDTARLTHAIDLRVRALGDRHWVLESTAEGSAELDPDRVTQAVLQLAENAVHHTAPGADIRLASRWVEVDGTPAVRFSVADDGPGIAPGDAERIFERFARTTVGPASGDSEASEGAGLGLAIVRAIADAHGGWVSIDSQLGRGSTFAITLPARAVVAHDGEDTPSEEDS